MASVTNGKSGLFHWRQLADVGEGTLGAVVPQILAEIMVYVQKALLVGGPFEHFLRAGGWREKTMGGLRQRTVALHGGHHEEGGFGKTGGFFRIACDIRSA